MMRIDAYTHFFPKPVYDKLLELAGDHKDIGKACSLGAGALRPRSAQAHRRRPQGLRADTLLFAAGGRNHRKKPGAIDEFIRLINDSFAELCAKESDHFPGWVAQISLDAADAGVAEAERAINQLGALGVQINTNVAGKPIDRPEYRPFWKKMAELGKPVWMHPARGAEMPDYLSGEEVALRDLVDVRLVL